MRIVLAPDKFRGSLSAQQAAEHIAAGVAAALPDAEITWVPVSDGGEGTLAVAQAAGFALLTVPVAGPTGEPVDSTIAVRGHTAVVELAAASGLSLLPGGRLAPLAATSLGTGQLMRAALAAGCTELILAVGGSACTDGGAGLLVGLGAQLLDCHGMPVLPGGAALQQLATADLSAMDPRLRGASIVLASDVDNPLLGAHGAAAVYGPQKGARSAEIAILERGLSQLVAVLTDSIGPEAAGAAQAPGAGAAGGVGYAALVLGATRRPGIDVMLELSGLRALLEAADVVITGEGSLDSQTLRGKAVAGIAGAAALAGVPVLALAGRVLLSPQQLQAAGISAAAALTDLEPDPVTCMQQAGPVLERLARQSVTLITGDRPDRPPRRGHR